MKVKCRIWLLILLGFIVINLSNCDGNEQNDSTKDGHQHSTPTDAIDNEMNKSEQPLNINDDNTSTTSDDNILHQRASSHSLEPFEITTSNDTPSLDETPFPTEQKYDNQISLNQQSVASDSTDGPPVVNLPSNNEMNREEDAHIISSEQQEYIAEQDKPDVVIEENERNITAEQKEQQDKLNNVTATHEEDADDIETFEEFKSRQNQDTPTNKQQPSQGNLPVIHKGGNNNFASHECGAKVVATNSEAKNPGAILTDNNDNYMLNPCSTEIWFVIELCELVSVSKFEIGSFELFSSIPESFAVYTSDSFPTTNWESLGWFFMRNERGVQEFLLADVVYAKYIKIVMLKHFGSEHYCPVSMVRVYGVTMMEEYEYSESQRELNKKNNHEEQITIKDDTSELSDASQSNGNPILAATDAIINVIGKAVNGLIEKVKDKEPDSAKEEESQDSTVTLESNEDTSSSTSSYSEINSIGDFTLSCSLSSTPLVNLSIPNKLVHTPLGPTSIDNILSHTVPIQQTGQITVEPDITTLTSSVSPTPLDKEYTSERIQETMEVIQPTQPNVYNNLVDSAQDKTDTINNSSTNTVNFTLTSNSTNNTLDNVTISSPNNNHTLNSSTGTNNTAGEEAGISNGMPREKSVFVRLSNRINNLELNMSLFGSYLEQISTSLKRSKNRTDDMQKSLERRMSSLNSTIHSYELQTQLNDTLLAHLNSSVEDLTLLVTSLYNEKYSLLESVFIVTLFLAILECLLLMCCCIMCLHHQMSYLALHKSLKTAEQQLHSLQKQLNHVNIALKSNEKCNGHSNVGEKYHVTLADDNKTCRAESDKLSHSMFLEAINSYDEQWQKVDYSKRKRKSLPSSLAKKDSKPNHVKS